VSSRKRPTGASHHGVAILLSGDSHGTATDEIDLVRDEDPARLKQRCDDLKSRLREASMLAAKAWKGGNSKNVGRQVARYHIEEVRIVLLYDIIPSRYADYRKNSRMRNWTSQEPASAQQS
jgi:hypothetical protein